ncbi:MAG: hypothetical protein ABSE62_06345 [Chthoniobacteraceae bacterium]|jgi:hypothetical protein
MPFKEWTIDLGEFRVFVWKVTIQGAITDFLVALLAWNGEKWVCVTRYDCAHDFPHRDIIGQRGGVLYKQRFPGLSLDIVFDHAIRDCQKNHEEHARFFRAH